MKDLMEVLRSKEEEVQRLRKEVEALRVAIHLLDDEEEQPQQLRRVVELP
jgi:hypothetical protein